MIKIIPSQSEMFKDFKCGEIYCITPSNYNVLCRLCKVKFPLEEFPQHFREHWDQLNESSNNSEHHTLGQEMLVLMENADFIKTENVEFQYSEPLQPKEMPFEELDEKPIDFEELQQIQLRELQASMAINSDKAIQQDMSIVEFIEPEEAIWMHDENDDNDNERDLDWQIEQCGDLEYLQQSVDVKSLDETDKGGSELLPFPCPKCDRSYESKPSLKNHLRTHKPKKPKIKKEEKVEYKCEECGEIFRNERFLICHKYKHSGLTCDVCGKTFTQIGNLMRHKIRHTGIKSFKCKECDYSFFTEKELRAHMLRHTKVMPIVCELCGRPCRDHGVLTAHMRRHTGERPAKCGVCGKSFFSGHDLNVHSITHTNERPFSCDVCGGTFKSKKSLRVHKLQHIPERNHICKICDKAFALEAGLNAHMRSHDAPYLERRV